VSVRHVAPAAPLPFVDTHRHDTDQLDVFASGDVDALHAQAAKVWAAVADVLAAGDHAWADPVTEPDLEPDYMTGPEADRAAGRHYPDA
jgi:hypothetical protein